MMKYIVQYPNLDRYLFFIFSYFQMPTHQLSQVDQQQNDPTKCLNKVLHHPKWPKCKFLHLHQNRSKLIKTGRNRSKQIVNDDMIYKKIKKEKRKCIFRTTREFICLNLFRPHSVFFPPKKILPYLCYVFPPSKNNISPFFSMPHFFCSTSCNIFFLLLYLLS